VRILYIHQYFSTNSGSTGTRSYEIVKELAGRGHEVTVLCGGSVSSETDLSSRFRFGARSGIVNGFRIVEFSGAYSNRQKPTNRALEFLSFAVRSLFYVIFGPRFDIAFATSTPLSVAIPAIGAGLLRRSRMIFEVRDLWPDLLVEMGALKNQAVIRLLRILEESAYKVADDVIVLAPGIAERPSRVRGGHRNVAVIPNGCDLALFDSSRPKNTSLKFSPRTPLLAAYTGTHGDANGLDFLIETARQLHNMGDPNVRIVLIGDGSQKTRLKSQALDENLSNLDFRESMPRKELASILPSMDVGLQILANYPGFMNGTSPNKVFDYMASGLPIAINYRGWISDKIEEQRCGWRVESPFDLAELLARLANSPELLSSPGQRSRACGEENFDRKKLVADAIAIIERVDSP